MRRFLLIAPLLVLVGGGIWAMGTGLDTRIASWAAEWQREFQSVLAQSLRALRAGEPGALAMMLGVCFAYGFFHAVGPGHGKLVIGGYGLGREVPFLRLAAISVLSSLGQATTAIALVGAGLLLLGWTRQQMTQIAGTTMPQLSASVIGLIGLWMMLRGLRRLWRTSRAVSTEATSHEHSTAHCDCGHRHGPTPPEMAGGGIRVAMALIAGIAIRPCSGAILLLVLTWYMDILSAGMLGTVAMSLGTASLTVGVAAVSVFARRTTVLSIGRDDRLRVALPILELAAGLLIAVLSIEMIGMMP